MRVLSIGIRFRDGDRKRSRSSAASDNSMPDLKGLQGREFLSLARSGQ
jgi:hypothetical protein